MFKINKAELFFAFLMLALVLVLAKGYGGVWWATFTTEGHLGEKIALGQIIFCCVTMICAVFYMAFDKKGQTKSR